MYILLGVLIGSFSFLITIRFQLWLLDKMLDFICDICDISDNLFNYIYNKFKKSKSKLTIDKFDVSDNTNLTKICEDCTYTKDGFTIDKFDVSDNNIEKMFTDTNFKANTSYWDFNK